MFATCELAMLTALQGGYEMDVVWPQYFNIYIYLYLNVEASMHTYIYIYICVCVCVFVRSSTI